MSNLARAMMMGAAGAAAGATYVDDVFSTFLYEGTYSAQPINNGIDLAGEGGLVWLKQRDVRTRSHYLFNSASGREYRLSSDLTSAEAGPSNDWVSSFNSNGFSIGAINNINQSGANFASWTFRKTPGFFDVVTYTGASSNSPQLIPHSLGSVPGMIMVKCASTESTTWRVYHRSLGATQAIYLDMTSAAVPSIAHWNDTAPTSTHFTVGSSNDVNQDGDTYVAYIFAHDDAQFGTNEDESIIKCGSFAGNASTTAGPEIDLGFEPQWLMVKRTDNNEPSLTAYHSWVIQDNMRGLNVPPKANAYGYKNLLFANSITAEGNRGNESAAGDSHQFLITPTGFTVQSVATEFNRSGGTYIYMAIRRPNKPPTAATDVFSPNTYTGNQTERVVGSSNNLSDFSILSDLSAGTTGWSSYAQMFFTRSMGGDRALASSTSAGSHDGWVNAYWGFDVNKGLKIINTAGGYTNNTGTNYVLYNFTRAPGFFDVVNYSGTGSARNQDHNLGVAPELVIVKARTGQYNMNWFVGPFTPGYSDGYLYLNTDMADGGNQSNYLPSVSSSTFAVTAENDVNGSGYTYISYLFATLSGISKVGSYSGTGNAVDVDCGFTAGARFVLIKRTNAPGDWYVWDTARGIVSGDDPYVLLNDDAVEVTNTDYIDPLTSGFTVTSSAPDALNVNGGNYLFLAIA